MRKLKKFSKVPLFPSYSSRRTKVLTGLSVAFVTGAGWATFWIQKNDPRAGWIFAAMTAGLAFAVAAIASHVVEFRRWSNGPL